MKGQGSSKTVRHCSAHIKAIKDLKTGRVTVNYTYTHYNHKTQLGHLRIPQATWRVIKKWHNLACRLIVARTPEDG